MRKFVLSVLCLCTVAAGSDEVAKTEVLPYNRVEAVYNFTKHRGWNFGEVQYGTKIAGKSIIFGGDYFGFHHGQVGMARVGVPVKIKGVPIIVNALGVFGAHENGPGVGVRWEWEKGRFYTQGLIGAYRPMGSKGIGAQPIADPVEVGYKPFFGKLEHLQTLYSYEGGRYGLYGAHRDSFHSVGVSHPINKKAEFVGQYVLGGDHIIRIGLLYRP